MDTRALYDLARELSSKGMLDEIKGGIEALPVSLTIRNDQVKTLVREKRGEHLKDIFLSKLNDIIGKDLEVDYNSLSIAGQSINAKLSLKNFYKTINRLEERNVEIFPNIKYNL